MRLRDDSLTHGAATGQRSPARRRYKGELKQRAREWARAARLGRLGATLQGRPNDIEFDLTQIL